jgi:tRNA threonylcarbamoyladenosine biosynthesis protein TsaE
LTDLTAAHHHRPIVESALEAATQAWHGEDDTAAFARRLAAQPALRNAYVTLHGDLGAGKTTLVRHLLRALGVQGRIKSPTYAVVEPHEAPGLAIWHFDFYRFDDPREWEDAGFRDIFATPGLKLAEWPEKAAALTPPADLAIHLEAIDEMQRHVTLKAFTPLGQALLQGLRA